MSPTALARLGLLIAAILWGSSFVVIKSTMTHDVFWMLGCRMFFAAIALILITRGQCLKIPKKMIVPWLWIAFWIVGTFAPQAYGLTGTSVANSAVLTALFVVITPGLMWFLKKGDTNLYQWAGAILGLFAFFVLGASQGFSTLTVFDFLNIVTAVAVAFHTMLFGEALKNPAHFFPVVFFQFAASAVMFFILQALTYGFSIPEVSPREWSGLLYLGLFTTAIPYIFQAYGQRHLPIVQVVLIIASEPLWAIAAASILRNDIVSGGAIAACAILLIANLVAELKPSKKTTSK